MHGTPGTTHSWNEHTSPSPQQVSVHAWLIGQHTSPTHTPSSQVSAQPGPMSGFGPLVAPMVVPSEVELMSVVEVVGPPETLALLLWGRVRADAAGLEIAGDRAGLDAALEAGLSA